MWEGPSLVHIAEDGMNLLSECRACGAPLSKEVFAMEPMPLAGAFAKGAGQARAAEKFPLTLSLIHI